MTNGRGAGMASFMTKKKKYKFQVDICLEELLEVPFVSAVLFAKLRLLDGGNFQDQSSREEVRDHKVEWNTKFSFPCKMMANASTGVLERCVLRISVRKESKGGRSFNKLGFVDLNLAEYAGAGLKHKKALLEGYDARHRQDNSMLKFSIAMNMLSGDILFKVPSPSLKHKAVSSSEDAATEPRSDDFSGGSLGGSIASGSSGFGSLPKKRPALLSSELVIGHTLSENNVPVTVAIDSGGDHQNAIDHEEMVCEIGHSRNSSNTSQLSKASGYSSIHSHSHSRQSSSGDSGHIRGQRPLRKPNTLPNNLSNFTRVNTYPNRLKIPNTIIHEDVYSTSPACHSSNDESKYYTPNESYKSQISSSSNDEYKTPDGTNKIEDVFGKKFINLRKSQSSSVVELLTIPNDNDLEIIRPSATIRQLGTVDRFSLDDAVSSEVRNGRNCDKTAVSRSKSEFEIPRVVPEMPKNDKFANFKSDLYFFLTPILKRKNHQSTPSNNNKDNRLSPSNSSSQFKITSTSPIPKRQLHSLPETRTTSLNSLRSSTAIGSDGHQLNAHPVQRGIPHRKLLEGNAGGKLAPLAISPDETPTTISSDCAQNHTMRRPSVTTNPSSSSLVLSETGSLDRAKAAYERRKKTQNIDNDNTGSIPGRVEITRVNPDDLIDELIKNTNLEQPDDSAETSGLQLFIAKDGTAALGNQEIKSQMSTGGQIFKQVVMDDNR